MLPPAALRGFERSQRNVCDLFDLLVCPALDRLRYSGFAERLQRGNPWCFSALRYPHWHVKIAVMGCLSVPLAQLAHTDGGSVWDEVEAAACGSQPGRAPVESGTPYGELVSGVLPV